MKKSHTLLAMLSAGLLAACLFVGCKKEEPAPPPPPPPEVDRNSSLNDNANEQKASNLDRRQELLNAFQNLNARKHGPRKRPLTELTAEQQARLDKLATALASAASSAEKMEALEAAADVHSQRLVELVGNSLDDEDIDVRLTAMELLYDFDDPSMIPVLAKGMSDPNEEVREAALSNLYYVTGEGVRDILAKGINDESDFVRDTALEMMAEQPQDVKFDLYEEALQNQNENVVLEVITNLEDESNHRAMDILITGLRHPNEQFREEVSLAIDFLIGQEFTSYDEAKAWWDNNRHNYDEELFEKL